MNAVGAAFLFNEAQHALNRVIFENLFLTFYILGIADCS